MRRSISSGVHLSIRTKAVPYVQARARDLEDCCVVERRADQGTLSSNGLCEDAEESAEVRRLGGFPGSGRDASGASGGAGV